VIPGREQGKAGTSATLKEPRMDQVKPITRERFAATEAAIRRFVR
jgi:hypothetical protein